MIRHVFKTIRGKRTQLAAILPLVMLLQACASDIVSMPPPGEAPETIAKDVAGLTKVFGNHKGVTTQQYVAHGYTRVRNLCSAYFDILTARSTDLQFNRAAVSDLGALSGTILSLASASTKAQGITAAGFGTVGSLFDDLQKYTILSAFPTETRDLVFNAMATYETALPPSSVANADYVGANTMVAGFADLCSYSRIMAFMKQAIAKAKTTTGEQPGGIFSESDRKITLKAINNMLGVKDDLTDDSYAALGAFANSDMSKKPDAAKELLKPFPDALQKKAFRQPIAPKFQLVKQLQDILGGMLVTNAAFKKRVEELAKQAEAKPKLETPGTVQAQMPSISPTIPAEITAAPRIPNVVVSPN